MIATIEDQLRRDEGCQLQVYTCPTGHLTIGVGRNLEATGITQAEADVLLRNDVTRVTLALHDALPWADRLDAARFGVLQNMAFNMGLAGLLEFERMLTAFAVGDWERAADELLDSDYAAQVGLRAERLAAQTRTGRWQ